MKQELKFLLQGVATNHLPLVRDSWRNLCSAGAASVPEITAKIASVNWHDCPPGPQNRYLAILLSLLHEIDSSAAEIEIKRLKSCRLHAMHRRTVSLIEARFDTKPEQHRVAGIPLTISRSVSNREEVLSHISKWIRTLPKGDLKQITRIDVHPFASELDYLGSYDLRTSAITLIWPQLTNGCMGNWKKLLMTQHTLYHEVGHHALGHIESGQDAEQEKEANNYASKMIRRARPGTTLFALVILKPLAFLLKIFRRDQLS